DIQTAWGVSSLPSEVGRDTEGILKALHDGEIESLLIGGVDPLDISAHLHDGLKKAFVVSLEIRKSAITDIANVVLPVAAVVEKSGTFVDWEGRCRSFDIAIQDGLTRSDVRVLSMLADQMGTPINLPTVASASKEFNSLGNWDERVKFSPTPAHKVAHSSSDALLSSWRLLLDAGSLQDGEVNLAGTAHPSVVVISKARAEKLGVKAGERVRVSNVNGEVTLPCEIADIEESSIWIPRNSIESRAIKSLGAVNGPVSVVRA
ncbi:MAG: molybdopterin dinucleotide binding domain-containing protein, partial [Actinomycetota bacterium]